MPARVLIRYLKNNPDARQRAESLANALTTQGIEVADVRESAGAVRTELSFSYAPDEAIALRVRTSCRHRARAPRTTEGWPHGSSGHGRTQPFR